MGEQRGLAPLLTVDLAPVTVELNLRESGARFPCKWSSVLEIYTAGGPMSPDRPAYTAKSPEKAGPPRIRFHDLQTHLRNHGAPERRERENGFFHAGSLLGGLHVEHLRPRYH